MQLIPTKLALPLFLVSRNRIHNHSPNAVLRYLKKRQKFYSRRCQEKPEDEEATRKKVEHLTAIHEDRKTLPCPRNAINSVSRNLVKVMPWQLKPNLYTLPNEVFSSRKGAGGAHWPKIGENKSIKFKRAKVPGTFYNMCGIAEALTKKCHKHKGVFLSAPRTGKPTDRCMVSDLSGCYRNPNEAGPAHYLPKLRSNISPKIETPLPNPHIFLRNSCIPVKLNKHDVKSSFEPGPGRYETRFKVSIPCNPKMIFKPDFEIYFDRQKRLKLRRLPYVKINRKLYCSPGMNHVEGRGHQHLFKGYEKKVSRKEARKAVMQSKDEYVRYPESPYINMINKPDRHVLSIRDPAPEVPKKIVYTHMARRPVRKQLQNNKKIAFLSGEKRFKDSDCPPPLTFSQLEKLKESLPVERQFRDHPVMQKTDTEIKPKFMEIPTHRQASYQPNLRKQPYKFLPMPALKVLVRESDIEAQNKNELFFCKELNVMDFLRKDSKITSIDQIYSPIRETIDYNADGSV